MAANNKIQYVLGISADTSQARKSIAELQKALNDITVANNKKLGLDIDLNNAAKAAQQLQSSLSAAINVDTGRLNFTAFNKSLMQSNTNLNQLITQLRSTGGLGNAAVSQLAHSLSTAEIPVKRLTGLLGNFATTLSNSFKWQISSNIIHGLESSMSSAVNYAKDLNETLNNIRIVTGQSVDDMAKFAASANKAAQELSTTTKEYANAALIYYQQGDSAEMAARKAATTVKAANVAFTASAKEMSEMLTAVWNSYQVGADQLESVVDVMAKLGATTASSMEEMATAMQKVASTANTVGVSMQQMSAIVATSASVTRQAPETVGTAWNTILSRIGGLKLGETLEDGVDLNKYSSALRTVGVNILDATGQLRDMGIVIDELGGKWQTLNKGQKAALAQTIGGARQYTQIMAFFDNFDKYQKNMITAQNSAGALQEQQEIYAQGWEAASARSRAALEDLWGALIDDEAVISFTNAMTEMTKGVTGLVKAFGGLPGILATVSSLMTRTFSNQIATNIGKAVSSVSGFFGSFKSFGGDYSIGQFLTGKMPNAENRALIQNLQTVQKEMENTASGKYLEPGDRYNGLIMQNAALQSQALKENINTLQSGGNLSATQQTQFAGYAAANNFFNQAQANLNDADNPASMSLGSLIESGPGKIIYDKIQAQIYSQQIQKMEDQIINLSGEDKQIYRTRMDALNQEINPAYRYQNINGNVADLYVRLAKQGGLPSDLDEKTIRAIEDVAKRNAGLINQGIAQQNPLSEQIRTAELEQMGRTAAQAAQGLTSAAMGFNQMNAAMQAFNAGNVTQGLTSLAIPLANVVQMAASGNKVGAAIAGIGSALGIVVGLIQNYEQKVAEEVKKSVDKVTESVNSISEKSSTILTTAESYNNLNSVWQAGTITIDEYHNSLLSTANALEVQGANVLALAGNYEELNAKVQSAIESQLHQQELNANATIREAEANMGNLTYNALEGNGFRGFVNRKDNSMSQFIAGTTLESINFLLEQNGYSQSATELLGLNSSNGLDLTIENLRKFISGYALIQDLVKNISSDELGLYDSDIGTFADGYLDAFKGLIEDINPAETAIYNSRGTDWINKNFTSAIDYDSKQRTSLTESFLEAEGLTDTDPVYNIAKQAFESLLDAAVAGMVDGGQLKSKTAATAAAKQEDWRNRLKRAGYSEDQINNWMQRNTGSWTKDMQWINSPEFEQIFAGVTGSTTAVNQMRGTQSLLSSWYGRDKNFNLDNLASIIFNSPELSSQFMSEQNWNNSSTNDKYDALLKFIDFVDTHQSEWADKANQEQSDINAQRDKELEILESDLRDYGLGFNELKQLTQVDIDEYNTLKNKTEPLTETEQASINRVEQFGGIEAAQAMLYRYQGLGQLPVDDFGVTEKKINDIIAETNALMDMDLSSSKWGESFQYIVSLLKENGKSFSDWLGMSDLEKQQFQLEAVRKNIEAIYELQASGEKIDENQLLQLEHQAQQLEQTINSIELTNFKTQMQEINDEWDNMRNNAEKALSLISNHLTNLGDLSFSDLETLRQTLLEAGLEAEHVAQILDDMRNANKGNKEDIWAGVMASTTAALMGITADQAQMKDVDEIVATGTIEKIKISEGVTIEPPNVDVPGDMTTVTTDNVESPVIPTQLDANKTVINIPENTEISVTPNANNTAVLNLPDGQQVLIQPDAAGNQVINLPTGTIVTVSPDALGQSTLHLPSGEEIMVQPNADGTTILNLPDGETIKVQPDANETNTIHLPSGEEITVQPNADGTTTLHLPTGEKITVQPDAADKGVINLPNGETITVTLDAENKEPTNKPTTKIIVSTLDAEKATITKPTEKVTLSATLELAKEKGLSDKEVTALEKELNTLFPNGQIEKKVALDYVNGKVEALKEARTTETKTFEIRYALSASAFNAINAQASALREDNNTYSGLDGIKQIYDLWGKEKAYKSNTFKSIVGGIVAEGNTLNIGDEVTQELIKAAAETFMSDDPQLAAIGEYLVAGLKLGLGDACNSANWPAIVAATGLSEDVLGAFRQALGIQSPSRLTMALAPYLIQGLQVGLTESIAEWQPDVGGLASKISEAIQKEFSDIDWYGAGFQDWLKDNPIENYQGLDDAKLAYTNMIVDPELNALSRRTTLSFLKGNNLTDNQRWALESAKSMIQLPGGKTDLDQLTDEELNDYLVQVQKTIDKYYTKLYNSSQSTFAEIEDIWGNALKQIFELDEESAKNTYNLWQKTFKSIADARKSLLNGDAIMKDMQGDIDSQANILRYLMETKGYSYEDAKAYMRNPDANYKELQFEAFGATQKSGLLSGADRPFYDEESNKLLLDEYRGLSDEQIMQKYRSGMREYTASALMGSQDSFLNYLSMMKQHSGDSDQSLAAYNTLMATSGTLNGQQISLEKLITFDENNLAQVADGHSFEDIMNAIFSPETIALWAKNMGYQTVEQIKQAMYEAGAQANDSEYMFDRSKVDEYRQAFTDLTEQELHNYMKTVKAAGLITGKTTEELEYNAAVLYRQSKGFDNAQSKMSKYQKTLQQISKNLGENRKYSNEYNKTLDDVREIYADLLELTPQESQELSEAFLTSTKNAKLLEKAIKGDEKAWDQLTAAAADDILSLKEGTDQIIIGTDEAGNAVQGQMSDLISSMQSWLDGQSLEVGAEIRDENFISQCEALVNQCASTAAEATAALSSLGVEAEIEEHRVPVPPKDKEVIIEGGHYQVPVLQSNGTYEIQDIPISATVNETDGGQEYVWYTIKGAHYNGRGVTHGGASTPKSSGGGGGGGKQHTKKEHKRVNKEGERYHEVRDKLEQQEHILDRIDKIKDRAYGGRHLKALNAEIEALEKQNKLQEEYYAEAAAYLASDRAELTQYGATFNPDGTVNYDEYIRKQIDWYNASVDASDDDETDKRIDEEYESRMKALENYEEALDLVDTIQNDILENQNKISEILLEGVQYKLEIAVDLNDRDLQKLDYYISKWSEVLSKQDESMEVSMMKMGDYESSLAAVGKAYQELQKGYAEGRLNDQDYSDGLADLQDKTLEYLESIQDLKKEIEEYYENTLSLAEEKQQKYTDKIEHTRDMMQSYIEMQQLMGRGQNFAELNSMYDTSYRSSLLTARAARDYLDTLYASRAAIVKEIEDSGWTETLKAQYDSVEEHIINAEDDLAQKTQQTLDDAKQKFMNVIDAIIKASDLAFKSLVDANGNLIKSFDEVAQDFNYWNEQQGWYVSTAKELYEVSKINRQIEDSLIDSTTATSKERLKALQSEINAYAEKNRLTEYDIEMNELQYKMALAMQDLEDTQNAKSTVRLTRDENGNYGYQYTANEDDVSEARQNFEDVLQQINELAYEHQNDLVQQMIESKQNYQSELREILDNDTLSLEERNRQAETLTEQHLAQMEYIQEQGVRAQEQLLENQGYIQEYYGQTIIENTGLVQDQIHGMMQQLMQDSSGYVEYIRTTLRQQLDEAIGGYSHDIDKVGGETGLTWGTMENSVSVYNKTNEKAAEDIKTLDQILGDSLKNISSATDSWIKHNAALEITVGNYEQLLNKMQGLQRSLADIDSINDRYYNNGAIYRPSEMGTTAALNALYNNKNTTNFTEDRFEGSANALGRLHNTTMSEYDISTSNLWNLIDSDAMSNLLGLISRGVNPNVINGNTNSDALSQVVNINASFDNIQSAQDIIDAFNQLTNLASQYAYSSGS